MNVRPNTSAVAAIAPERAFDTAGVACLPLAERPEATDRASLEAA